MVRKRVQRKQYNFFRICRFFPETSTFCPANVNTVAASCRDIEDRKMPLRHRSHFFPRCACWLKRPLCMQMPPLSPLHLSTTTHFATATCIIIIIIRVYCSRFIIIAANIGSLRSHIYTYLLIRKSETTRAKIDGGSDTNWRP